LTEAEFIRAFRSFSRESLQQSLDQHARRTLSNINSSGGGSDDQESPFEVNFMLLGKNERGGVFHSQIIHRSKLIERAYHKCEAYVQSDHHTNLE
jgi:hypothetical protein